MKIFAHVDQDWPSGRLQPELSGNIKVTADLIQGKSDGGVDHEVTEPLFD